MNQEYAAFINDHGMYLEEKLGVKEWAFTRADALKLLEIMKQAQMPNIGGDVVIENEGGLNYTNDSWYYNRSDHETQEQYVVSSISKAEEYIKNYPERGGGKYYYVTG